MTEEIELNPVQKLTMVSPLNEILRALDWAGTQEGEEARQWCSLPLMLLAQRAARGEIDTTYEDLAGLSSEVYSSMVGGLMIVMTQAIGMQHGRT
jgi:hypothetical protein